MAKNTKKVAVTKRSWQRGALRAEVLAALKVTPSTRAQLIRKLGCSVAAVDGHLRTLRAEGAICADGRYPIVFSVARGRKLGRAARAAGFSDLKKKIAFLEHLAALLPAPMADVLLEIRRDYLS